MRRVPTGLTAWRRVPAGLAACLTACLAVAGCGTAASHSGSGSGPAARTTSAAVPAPGTTAPGTTAPGTTATAEPAGAGVPAACQGRVPAAGALTITLAGNGKTYCVRVGQRLRVYLRGTVSSTWLRPAASSAALVPAPDPAGTLARGVTGASFAAVRAGRVLVTSVRPPCRLKFPVVSGGGLEPADPVPTTYPLRSCPLAQRFSASIIVLRST